MYKFLMLLTLFFKSSTLIDSVQNTNQSPIGDGVNMNEKGEKEEYIELEFYPPKEYHENIFNSANYFRFFLLLVVHIQICALQPHKEFLKRFYYPFYLCVTTLTTMTYIMDWIDDPELEFKRRLCFLLIVGYFIYICIAISYYFSQYHKQKHCEDKHSQSEETTSGSQPKPHAQAIPLPFCVPAEPKHDDPENILIGFQNLKERLYSIGKIFEKEFLTHETVIEQYLEKSIQENEPSSSLRNSDSQSDRDKIENTFQESENVNSDDGSDAVTSDSKLSNLSKFERRLRRNALARGQKSSVRDSSRKEINILEIGKACLEQDEPVTSTPQKSP